MEGARLYLEAEIDKDNSNMREVKIHFCDFIRIMIKNFSCEYSFIFLFYSYQIQIKSITMYHYQFISNTYLFYFCTLYQWKRATLYCREI